MDVVPLFYCFHCQKDLAEPDLKRIRAGTGELLVCTQCGDMVRVETSRVVQPLVGELATAFRYPFRPTTLLFSVLVTLFAGACGYLRGGPFLAAGIRLGWLFAVLRTASRGQEEVDIDVTEVSPLIRMWAVPALRFVLAALVAFLPAIVASWLGIPVLALPLGLCGAFYLPAALVVVSEDERWHAGLNPTTGIALITRIPGAYATAIGLLLVLLAVTSGVTVVAESLEIPVVSFVLEHVIGYLALVAAARMLGILVYEKREEL